MAIESSNAFCPEFIRMSSTQSPYFDAFGLVHWQKNTTATPIPAEIISPTAISLPDINARVRACQACALCQTRTQTVFGIGNPNANLMVIGEAPGFHEDQQGEPFVGDAGQLLTKMLKAINLAREEVYIANVLKCRPPNNRDPLPQEVATCTPFLVEQINSIKPKLLLAVGRVAAHYLLQTKASLESLRGKIHQPALFKTPLIVTYHPAYLLRNPADKRKAWADLQFAEKTLGKYQR